MIGRRPDYFDRMLSAGVVISFALAMGTTGKPQAIALVMGIALELTRLVHQ